MGKKFVLKCLKCGCAMSFKEWFNQGQICSDCRGNFVDVVYNRNIKDLYQLIQKNRKSPETMWIYEDFLPVEDSRYIISNHEGQVPIERWEFMEELAREKYGVRCKVYAHRLDRHVATGTFKDLSGSVVASVLSENDQKQYVVASTGNTAVAYSRYCAEAGITIYAFIPENASMMQAAAVGSYGQRVFRVLKDYVQTKGVAGQFAEKHGYLKAAGNLDPMRIEAKKTMVYEWLRQLDDYPTVYVQALSGGTGPLAIDKVYREFEGTGLLKNKPRQILVQTDQCAPMAHAWKKAKSAGFPDGWENDYPVYENPVTIVPTIANGNPKTYPIIGPLVRESGGEIIAYDEKKAVDVARLVAFERMIHLGPTAALPLGGMIQSFARGAIRDGDVVMIMVGEGCLRSPEFMKETVYTAVDVKSADDCSLFERERLRDRLWQAFDQ